MDVVLDVEQFILKELMTGSTVDAIPADEDLLASGIVDSHGVMQLVAFLRERYGVSVRDDELTPENFQTIAAISAFVERAKG